MNEDNRLLHTKTVFRQLFGDNRAEWPLDEFGELFVTPTYQTKLQAIRPCLLVGGRGTGKTTSLQSLTYQATYDRLRKEGLTFSDQEYFGILVRMNKNRVRAFRNCDRSNEEWSKAFAHYANLLICLELAKLKSWLEEKTDRNVTESGYENIRLALCLPAGTPCSNLVDQIRKSIIELEVFVNNPAPERQPVFSLPEAPLRTFVTELQNADLLNDSVVFCCIDEYENLLDYQQALLNTYIKHAEPPLTYKIGVRKNGLRTHRTTDGSDLLKTPDDYASIEIAEEGFEYFAKAVCELRLRRAADQGVKVALKLEDFLQDLSFSDEASLLGADRVADRVLDALATEDEELWRTFSDRPKTETYFLEYWHQKDGVSIPALARDWLDNEKQWKNRLGNHGFASLFWLSRGKGVRTKKYYCGARTFLALPAGNIRYFLELLDSAAAFELDSRGKLGAKPLTLSPQSQTRAAKAVGTRRINQLEGLAENGVKLKRLVLGIGRVFFEFARSPTSKTPEVTSFVLTGESHSQQKIRSLLSDGVGHLAFAVSPRTKETGIEIKDDEYRIHPIFSAYFVVSHRKKRRKIFDAADLLEVISNPARGMDKLLGGIGVSDDDELPEQLAFFSAFYEGGSADLSER